MIQDLKKEIKNLLKDEKNNISVTFVGSSKIKKIEEISDIDIVVICKNMTEKYYKKQIKKLQEIDSKFYKSKFDKIYINNSFGPLKFNKHKTLVLHLMIYDLKTHKQHVIESPFTCLDWAMHDASYGDNLRDLYPIFDIQLKDFREARRSLKEYNTEFKEGKLSYREYLFTSNEEYLIVKKYKLVEDRELFEFMYHIVKFSLINLSKFVTNKNIFFTEDQIFSILPEFVIFKNLYRSLDRIKNNQDSYDIKEISQQCLNFLMFYHEYLNNKENEIESKKIYFLRHSKTNLNDGTFLGIRRNPDVEKKITKEKIKILKNINIKNFFTSRLKRAINTVNQLTDHYSESELLNEIDYGEIEGLTLTQVKNRYPQIIKSWSEGTDDHFPGGENLNDVQNRLNMFLSNNHLKTPLLGVTHQVFIRIAFCNAINLPINESYKLNIEHEEPYCFYNINGNFKSDHSRNEIYKIYEHD